MALNDTPRAARKARPKTSLKMQAIGFLSRREHSRQELRTKLLASLHKRAREEAALATVAERNAREIADALRSTPANGIDDAFAPTVAPAREFLPASTQRRAMAGRVAVHGTREEGSADADVGSDDDSDAHASARARARASASASASAGASANASANLDAGADDAAEAEAEAEAEATAAAEAASAAAAAAAAASVEPEPEAVVDELLDWLVANKYLSEDRFVESRVNARSRKQGAMMIKHDLARHGLVLAPEQAVALRQTEFARAQALWQRKFGELASDPRGRAKQARFLASRGFASDVVRRIVGGEDES